MARALDDASNQVLRVEQAVRTTYPLTMACWFNVDDDSVIHTLMCLVGKSGSDCHVLRALRAVESRHIGADTRSSLGWGSASSDTGYTVGQWHHACGVFASATNRKAFLDGDPGNQNATNRTPAGLDRTSIGSYDRDTSPLWFVSGLVAEAAIWAVALTDAEVAILAKGYSPLFIRPQSLVAYWPLIRDPDNDAVGGYNLTPVNSPTVANHCRILRPAPPLVQGKPGISIPVLIQHYKKMRVA